MTPQEMYVCMIVREFPAQALLRLRPDLQAQPCVVLQGEPPLQTVVSLNTQARLMGLRAGMTRVEAETFPGVVLLQRSPAAEAATRAVLLECAGNFSPRVEERSEPAAFLCGIDIAGTQSLFGPPEMLTRSLRQRVRALGLQARLTASRNFETAVCLAKGLPLHRSLQIAADGEEAAALAPLPLSVLSLTDAQAETFSLWGIRTLGMLAALPERELIARVGQQGQRLRRLASGTLPHLFQPAEMPFLLEEHAELDQPLENLESLLFGVSVMLEQLILRARARVLALAAVTITLQLESGAPHCRTVRPAQAANEKQLWLKLLHLDLEAHPPAAAITAVTLQAEPGSPRQVQLGLFAPQVPEPGRLDITLARISSVVGEDNVGRAVLEDTHAPDAFRMERFRLPVRRCVPASPRQPRASLRRLRPPERTAVTLRDGRPQHLVFREQRYAVVQAYGPWLESGNWWTEKGWKQEQWDLIARASDGALLYGCVVQERQNQWRMITLYD